MPRKPDSSKPGAPEPGSNDVLLRCGSVVDAIEDFVALGFDIDGVFPADSPRLVELSGYGLTLTLSTVPRGFDQPSVQAANPAEVGLKPALTVSHPDADAFGVGRAGMLYRDLIPDRQGGRFIASHIRIPIGGPVADQVHYHHVAFQMLYCVAGWVRLVYEDQGAPFVLQAGDAVLQPPEIRHRVLESSDDFDIVEIGDPAEHRTRMDRSIELPTPTHKPDRRFGGQRFHHHRAAEQVWADADDGTRCADLGITAATGGYASAQVLTMVDGAVQTAAATHGDDLAFMFVLAGSGRLVVDGLDHHLEPASAATVPRGAAAHWTKCSPDLRWLEVRVAGLEGRFS